MEPPNRFAAALKASVGAKVCPVLTPAAVVEAGLSDDAVLLHELPQALLQRI